MDSQLNHLTTDAEPIACSLPAAALREREQMWSRLAATALRRRVATPSGVRLEFVADHVVAHQLLDLVQAERECCGWASWNLSQSAAETVIEVSADGPAIRAVRQMLKVA